MSISSEKLRKVLHPIQIDTMHFRFKPRRNPGSQSQHRSVNRTAVMRNHSSTRSTLKRPSNPCSPALRSICRTDVPRPAVRSDTSSLSLNIDSKLVIAEITAARYSFTSNSLCISLSSVCYDSVVDCVNQFRNSSTKSPTSSDAKSGLRMTF